MQVARLRDQVARMGAKASKASAAKSWDRRADKLMAGL